MVYPHLRHGNIPLDPLFERGKVLVLGLQVFLEVLDGVGAVRVGKDLQG